MTTTESTRSVLHAARRDLLLAVNPYGLHQVVVELVNGPTVEFGALAPPQIVMMLREVRAELPTAVNNLHALRAILGRLINAVETLARSSTLRTIARDAQRDIPDAAIYGMRDAAMRVVEAIEVEVFGSLTDPSLPMPPRPAVLNGGIDYRFDDTNAGRTTIFTSTSVPDTSPIAPGVERVTVPK